MTIEEPFESLPVPTQPQPQQWLRDEIAARWLAILNHRREHRGITLTAWQTRVVRKGDIHEIITTPEISENKQKHVDQVYYLGFAEFEAGIIAVNDGFWTENGALLGHVIGFDETHAPNHLNILLFSPSCLPGLQRGLHLFERLFIRKQE